ncbi:pentatricopeptide repeat-containing protein [Pyrus ussuriensis x Pyrus communis]|uniref:Pentatricopeptide repeat-containing protein n=1 Tax=Pyrus ussuriensis x Pyrus communis TaxID=2448454 RepID=A0A5N5INN1_9ROSA|nr:pentatricopeptide repeat-containing protein [Pyrus ussuriensis x Pyrus communis]
MQPEKDCELLEVIIEEGCDVNTESYTALVPAYGRSGLFDKAFSLLELMKNTPDVHTYSILLKSCLQVFAYDKVQDLLLDMETQGMRPNTFTYNKLIDAYVKSKRFAEIALGDSGQIETTEKSNITTFNILLDCYGKAGKYENVSVVMEYMQKYHYSWTIMTYNVVIDEFGRAGDLKQVECLFRLMRSKRIKLSCVTLCSLVRAYSLADAMLDTVFFNCLVDAYGRMRGFTEMKEVLEIMEQKGCRPNKVTYTTMIKAFSVNKMIGHLKRLRELMESAEGSQMTLFRKEKPDFR